MCGFPFAVCESDKPLRELHKTSNMLRKYLHKCVRACDHARTFPRFVHCRACVQHVRRFSGVHTRLGIRNSSFYTVLANLFWLRRTRAGDRKREREMLVVVVTRWHDLHPQSTDFHRPPPGIVAIAANRCERIDWHDGTCDAKRRLRHNVVRKNIRKMYAARNSDDF